MFLISRNQNERLPVIIFRAGDKVTVNCSPESDVLARVKKIFAGRVGVITWAWSLDDGSQLSYRNCTVRFPAIGKKKEQEIEINFDNLLAVDQQPQMEG